MNLNKIFLISLLLIAVLSLTAVSASEDADANLTSVDKTDGMNLELLSSQSTQSTDNSSDLKNPKIKTKVKFSGRVNQYKKSSYYKVKIIDKQSKKPIKYLKLSFKIKNGKKYKTYVLKTDKNGIAKFNTKKLKLGNHKVIISSENKNYDVSDCRDSVFIGKVKKPIYLGVGKTKRFKNGDAFYADYEKSNLAQNDKGFYVINNCVDKYGLSPDPKTHVMYKAQFLFKNNNNGKIISKTVKGNSYLLTKLIKGYTPFKTKIWFLQS